LRAIGALRLFAVPLQKAEGVGTSGRLGVRGALAAALLLVAVMLVLSAASADAAFPGEEGKIAFTRDNFRQGTSGIFAVAPEGAPRRDSGPNTATPCSGRPTARR
jgi:hypothetical protein